MSNNTPPAPEVTEIGEQEFDETYDPIPGPEGSDWRDHHEVPEGTPVENVWTVVDGDEHQWILPGYHMVNYVARVVTNVPWPHEFINVRVDAFDEEPWDDEDYVPPRPVETVWLPGDGPDQN